VNHNAVVSLVGKVGATRDVLQAGALTRPPVAKLARMSHQPHSYLQSHSQQQQQQQQQIVLIAQGLCKRRSVSAVVAGR
jgi:hypothetical protein